MVIFGGPLHAMAGFDEEAVTTVLARAIVAALVGARATWVLNHLSRFDSPLEVLRVWEGGASLLGGIAAALAVAVFELRRRFLPVLGLLDLAGPWFTLRIAVGGIGDLLIADHLGDPTGYRQSVDRSRLCGRWAHRAHPGPAPSSRNELRARARPRDGMTRPRRGVVALLALTLSAAACTTDDPPTLDIDPDAPRLTSDTLPDCPSAGPDETTPPAGCLDPEGRVVRP